MHAFAEALLADAHQVLERVGRKTVGLWIRPSQHDAHQLGLLLRVERGRPTIAPAVGEAVDPVLVVAQHPVAQRLPVHAGRPLPPPGSCRESDWRSPGCGAPHACRSRPWPACEALSECGPLISSAAMMPSLNHPRLGNHDPAHLRNRRTATGVIYSVRRYDRGEIVSGLPQKTASGSGSCRGAHGITTKPARRFSTLLDKSHAYIQNRPLAPIATVISPSVRFTATIRRITPSCTPPSAQFADATARRRRRHGTK